MRVPLYKLLFLAAFIISAPSSQASVILLEDDFDSLTVGSQINGTNGWTIFSEVSVDTGSGTQTTRVADVTGIGGSGNAAHYVDSNNDGTVSNMRVRQGDIGWDPSSTGTIAFDLYVDTFIGGGISFFGNEETQQDGIFLQIARNDGAIRNRNSTGAYDELGAAGTISTGQWYHYELRDISLTDSHYDLVVSEGVGGSATIVAQQNDLEFRGSISELIRFDWGSNTSNGAQGADLYLDNFLVTSAVPEPATVFVMLGLVGCAFFLRRRMLAS
ncbi:MAG: PEP-CTERM sorting domain-containing protein [Verrucomicrobiales bacterium]|nr:PEP-CTERM sorting domain-containing protein [Verrucomicrobiales bacterium]